jgi:hypothetical protein
LPDANTSMCSGTKTHVNIFRYKYIATVACSVLLEQRKW